MFFSFLVTLREGIEIALVITILLGYLRNIGQTRHFRDVWLGAGVAGVLALGLGIGLEVASREMDGRILEAFEGFTMLFAVGVLTWMVFWMKRQSAGISRELRQQVDAALSRGSVVALALLAFSAVGREGLETTLFLFAGSQTNSGVDFVAGGVLGFAIAAVAGVMLYYGGARLPLKQFFLLTGIAVVVLAAGLLTNGVAELHEAGLIADIGSRPWDTESVLPMTSTLGKFLHTVLGYDSAPAMAQIALYWTYVVVALGAYVLWPVRRPVQIRRVDAPDNMATVVVES